MVRGGMGWMPRPKWWLTLAFVSVGFTSVCFCGLGLRPAATQGGCPSTGVGVGVIEVCDDVFPRRNGCFLHQLHIGVVRFVQVALCSSGGPDQERDSTQKVDQQNVASESHR